MSGLECEQPWKERPEESEGRKGHFAASKESAYSQVLVKNTRVSDQSGYSTRQSGLGSISGACLL